MHTLRTHTFRRALTGAATAALGLLLATGGPAGAAEPAGQPEPTTRTAGPGFLGAGDLPPHSTPWQAGEITAGLPDPVSFCLAGSLPAEGSSHRGFQTGLDTNATQINTVTGSPAEADRLARKAEKKVAGCAADWLRATPGGTASWQDHGTVDAGEGAHLYGIHTAVPNSEPSVHLFGVGHDGDTVTVVRWGEIGDLDQAPVKAFAGTVRTAVEKLG